MCPDYIRRRIAHRAAITHFPPLKQDGHAPTNKTGMPPIHSCLAECKRLLATYVTIVQTNTWSIHTILTSTHRMIRVRIARCASGKFPWRPVFDNGQLKFEPRPLSRFAEHLERATHLFYQSLCNTKSDTATFMTPRKNARVSLHKWIENLILNI